MVFIDVKKVYEKVPRDVLMWELMEKRLLNMYVNLIEDMYEESSARVRNSFGKTEEFYILF